VCCFDDTDPGWLAMPRGLRDEAATLVAAVGGTLKIRPARRSRPWRFWDWARSSGYERLWATVWEWNTAARRVLAKAGFTETGRNELDAVYGSNLFTTRRL
jgi:hypothetical protein